jgi:protein-S-isoprenylcysteine O-methyltransferase Ste14
MAQATMFSDWPSIARRIRVPLGFAFAFMYVWLARPTCSSIVIGTIIAIPGLWLRGLAAGHVRKDTELTTGGPYAYTRNPLYLGTLILAAGFAAAARSWVVAGIMVVIFLGIYVPVIWSEEAFLRENFREFSEYSARVPRLLPRLPAVRTDRGTFSWELYRKHREYNAILGTAAMVAILIAKLFWISA